MKLRELLSQMKEVQEKIGASDPYICGGTPRDKYLKRLDNIADIDITTGDKTVDYLSQEFAIILKREYNVTRKTMEDGHSSIFVGNIKVDFSSNFVVPGIERYLGQMGIDRPTDMQKEMFSRDFTCNTLLMTFDLQSIIDPTKRAFNDLKNRKIVTCLAPEITLTTNRNRVARAIYLSSKLDFNIDEKIIEFVRQNPQSIKISTEKTLSEKINEAFKRNPDRASHLISRMGLWNLIPITKIVYPYYMKHKNGVING